MPKEAERVAVGAAGKPGRRATPDRCGENLIARTPLLEGSGQDVLPAIAAGQRGLEPLGHVLFISLEHVRHFLSVGAQLQVAEPHVIVQNIARVDPSLVATVPT